MEERIKSLKAQLFADALALEIAERGAEVPWDLSHDELFGILLKQVRAFRGMSQSGLAKASGVQRLTILELEAGRRTAQEKTVRRLAKALRVPEAQLDLHQVFRYVPVHLEAVAEQIREGDKQACEQREQEKERA